jgi:hypothetical protein
VRKFLRRFGHRASALFGFGCVAVAYGIGLVLGYHPTFFAAYNLPLEAFGWIWIGVGAFSFTGAFTRGHDAWQFAVSELAAVAWSLLLATHWISPYGWTSGVSWAGIALGLLLASTWSDAPREVVHPDLARIERLVNGSGERESD